MIIQQVKFKGYAHSNCNTNPKLTKKVPAIFHNLGSQDGHLIMQNLSKLHVEMNIIPNELGKYIAFAINKHLVFIDNMQFKNSSLDGLVKLSDKDFKVFVTRI